MISAISKDREVLIQQALRGTLGITTLGISQQKPLSHLVAVLLTDAVTALVSPVGDGDN